VVRLPGISGSLRAGSYNAALLRTLGVAHWMGGRLLVSRAQHAFDGDGTRVDETVRSQLARFLEGFAVFAQAQRD
jgi:chromate reductase